jgi:hypothetical protein
MPIKRANATKSASKKKVVVKKINEAESPNKTGDKGYWIDNVNNTVFQCEIINVISTARANRDVTSGKIIGQNYEHMYVVKTSNGVTKIHYLNFHATFSSVASAFTLARLSRLKN